MIIDCLINIVHYKPLKITINASRLAEVIFDVVIWHHGLPNSIIINKNLLFTLKFWSLLCYFLDIRVLPKDFINYEPVQIILSFELR